MKQKEFTRDDYKDLDFVGKKRLKEYRDGLAKELNQKRNTINSMLEGELDGLKGIEGLQGEYERAKKHAKYTAKIRRAWNILDTRDNARRKKFDESMKSIDRQFDVKDSIRKHEELAEKLRAKKALGKDLKKAGKVAAGTALAAGLIYGAKKLYDKNKNKDMKEQKEFARTVYETESKNVPMETPKVAKEKASKLRDMFNRAKESIKNSKAGKNAAEFYAKHEKGVKIGGGVAAGTALAAGLAVGAKKLADKKKEQQKEFARADYEGLNFIETFKKNYKRNRVAQELKKQRNQINKELEENLKYNASRAKKIANLKRTKALDSIRLGETMENLANLAGSPAEAFKKKPMSNLKKAGYAGLGVAGAAGLAYGGKKIYDKYKKNNESDNKD
jgi:hypothetical protein